MWGGRAECVPLEWEGQESSSCSKGASEGQDEMPGDLRDGAITIHSRIRDSLESTQTVYGRATYILPKSPCRAS